MRLVGVVVALLAISIGALAAPAPAGAQSPPAIPAAGWTVITAPVDATLWYGDRAQFAITSITAPQTFTEVVCVEGNIRGYTAQTGGNSLGRFNDGQGYPLAAGQTVINAAGMVSGRLGRPDITRQDGATIMEWIEVEFRAYYPVLTGDCSSGPREGVATAGIYTTPRTEFTYVPYNPTDASQYTIAVAPTEPAVGESVAVVVTLMNTVPGPGRYCYWPILRETLVGGSRTSSIQGDYRLQTVRTTTSWSWTWSESTLAEVSFSVEMRRSNGRITQADCNQVPSLEANSLILTPPTPPNVNATWRALAPTTSNELSVNISTPFPTVGNSADIISTFENTSPHTAHYCYKVVIRERGVDLYQSPYYVVQGGETVTGGGGTGEIADLVYSVLEPDVVSRSFQVRLWRWADPLAATGSPPAVPTTCTFNELNAAEAISAGVGTVTISWRIGPGTLSPDDGECPTCFLEYQPQLTSPPIITETATPGTYEITLDWTPISPSSTGIERTEYEIVIEPNGIPINPGDTELNGGTPTIARNDDEATAVITYVANDIGTPRRQIFIRAKWYTVSGGYPFPRASGQIEIVQGNQYIYSGWGKYYIFLTGLTPYIAPATPTPVPGAVAMHERGVRPQARAAADGAVQDAARLFIDLFTLYEYDLDRTPDQNAVDYQAMQVEWQSYLWAAFTLVITLIVAVVVAIGTKTFTATAAAICALVFILLWFFGGLAFGGFTVPFATIPVVLLAGAGGIYWWTNR